MKIKLLTFFLSPTIKDNVNHNRRKQNFKSYDVMQYIKRMEVHIRV